MSPELPKLLKKALNNNLFLITLEIPAMKKQKILFYLFKWLAFIFLSYLIMKENHTKIMMLVLIVFVFALLIWEGIRDFSIKRKTSSPS
jgi:hypothetical protein